MGDHAAAADGDLVFVPTLPGVDPRGCALSSIISNKTFLNGIADLIARSGDPEGALARSLRAAAALAGRTDTPCPPGWCCRGIPPAATPSFISPPSW
ncbi:hypothetical protein ABZ412_06555 [Nocardia sp. NPDC005746]|uniref:hypothetical protein n=1 Tax=Nocardia sp. NPDC005746 TaxID=3157062 RepID=UPI0033EEEBFB